MESEHSDDGGATAGGAAAAGRHGGSAAAVHLSRAFLPSSLSSLLCLTSSISVATASAPTGLRVVRCNMAAVKAKGKDGGSTAAAGVCPRVVKWRHAKGARVMRRASEQMQRDAQGSVGTDGGWRSNENNKGGRRRFRPRNNRPATREIPWQRNDSHENASRRSRQTAAVHTCTFPNSAHRALHAALCRVARQAILIKRAVALRRKKRTAGRERREKCVCSFALWRGCCYVLSEGGYNSC